MTGFASDVDRYFFFLLIVFLVGLCMTSVFRFVAYAAPSIVRHSLTHPCSCR